MKPRLLIVNAIAGVEAVCIGGILWFGARLVTIDHVPSAPVAGEEAIPFDASVATTQAVDASPHDRSPDEGSGVELWSSAPQASERTPISTESRSSDDRERRGERPIVEPRRERDYHRALLALATRNGAAELERVSRSAIDGSGPDCEKVAALRAVRDAKCAGAFELCAHAAETLTDECGPRGDSVPRFALRMLVGEAPREERARRALERLAWDRRLSSNLRCIAAAGLASIPDEALVWRIVLRLETEDDERIRECTVRALERNAAATPAARSLTQGHSSSGADAGTGSAQE